MSENFETPSDEVENDEPQLHRLNTESRGIVIASQDPELKPAYDKFMAAREHANTVMAEAAEKVKVAANALSAQEDSFWTEVTEVLVKRGVVAKETNLELHSDVILKAEPARNPLRDFLRNMHH